MKPLPRQRVWVSIVLVAGACASPSSAPSTEPPPTEDAPSITTTTSTVAPPSNVPARAGTVDLADAVAVGLATNGSGPPAIGWITPTEVVVARLELASLTIADPVMVQGDVVPFAHPIERPALAVEPDDTIHIAFTALMEIGGTVYLNTIVDGSAGAPEAISGEPMPETNLVHMTLDDAGLPVLSWLEDSTLSVAATRDGVLFEVDNVDDLTCDCCNPVPLFVGDDLIVAYRDLERRDGEVIRNVAAVRSLDGGSTFEDHVQIADDDWFIDACPFTGPSTVEVDGNLVVAWMDARQSLHADQRSSSIWVDISSDGGSSFGTDLQVSGDGINRWPVMATDDLGTIHLVWERQGSEGGLLYTGSVDGGASFAEPRVLVGRAAEGPPKTPSIIHHDGSIVVSWTVAGDGRVGVWDAAELRDLLERS